MSARRLLPLAMLLGACAIPNAIDALDQHSPPPEFGRPMWVRVPAGVGAWVGGIVGGVVSIVCLPVTWPISELASDGLGEHGGAEFLFAPAITGAALGHCVFGLPPDLLDWSFRRVWVGTSDSMTSYEFIPLPGPIMPLAPGTPAAGEPGPDSAAGSPK